MKKKTREIARLLFNGHVREENHHRLPPEIKRSLMSIARQENKSMSWVLEQVIIQYFQLDEPRYKETKNDNR